LPVFPIILPNATKKISEGAYISRVNEHIQNTLILHTKEIRLPGTSQIEICDIAFPDGVLLHIKKGKNSSSLSHLFSQAVVSAELLLMNNEFKNQVRQKVEERIREMHRTDNDAYTWLYSDEFQPARCNIALGIMSGCEKKNLSALLPFFSKINLRMRCEDLRRMGYRYSIAQITI
jgi:uncharacterized protein (TIGR04141 family)